MPGLKRTRVRTWDGGSNKSPGPLCAARRMASVKMFWVARQITRVTVKTLRRSVTLMLKAQDPDSWEARYWPGRSFVPPKFDGTMTVFRVSKQDLHRPNRRDLGWSEWNKQGVDLYDVPGEHATLLREPHVQAVASILAKLLVRVEPAELSSSDAGFELAMPMEAPTGEFIPEMYAKRQMRSALVIYIIFILRFFTPTPAYGAVSTLPRTDV